MKQLKIKGLCKTYIVDKRPNNVLRNIDLTINDGEMVAIMGPSGSGKTTLLYTVSGMDQVTSGSIDFFGRELSQLKPKEISDIRLNEMGFVFQNMYMLKNLSVYDNIVLPAYQTKKGQTKKGRININDRATKMMKKMGIDEIAHHAITEVSGGQLQRACICRSLMNQPKIIFADEPTGALNKQSSREVMKELTSINQNGTTIMLVTHDLKVACVCEKVLYIEDGTIKDEKYLGKMSASEDVSKRERELNNWLFQLGW